MKAPLLTIEDARVRVTGAPDKIAVDGVDVAIGAGEVVGLVGESGCGKSVTALSTLGLLPPSLAPTGTLRLGDRSYDLADPQGLAELRGRDLAMVFQDPGTSLNPVMPVGRQIGDVLRVVEGRGSRGSRARAAVELLERVGVPAPDRVSKAYPFELSGGMRQRVLIAMALACRPRLLIADEPTTALDATVQAQIVALLKDLATTEEMAILFISHDLALVGEFCERLYVMYAGRVVEHGPVAAVLQEPHHPYTAALVECLSTMSAGAPRLRTVPGAVPALGDLPIGCRFAPRCEHATRVCHEQDPQLRPAGDATSACLRLEEITLLKSATDAEEAS